MLEYRPDQPYSQLSDSAKAAAHAIASGTVAYPGDLHEQSTAAPVSPDLPAGTFDNPYYRLLLSRIIDSVNVWLDGLEK